MKIFLQLLPTYYGINVGRCDLHTIIQKPLNSEQYQFGSVKTFIMVFHDHWTFKSWIISRLVISFWHFCWIYILLTKMKYIKHFHYMCLTKSSREILIEFATVTRNKKQNKKITAIYPCIWMFLFQKIRLSNRFVKHKF